MSIKDKIKEIKEKLEEKQLEREEKRAERMERQALYDEKVAKLKERQAQAQASINKRKKAEEKLNRLKDAARPNIKHREIETNDPLGVFRDNTKLKPRKKRHWMDV